MKDKVFVVIPTYIKEEGKEGVSCQDLLRLTTATINSFFDNLTHKNVEVLMVDDDSFIKVFNHLSQVVKNRFPKAIIIRNPQVMNKLIYRIRSNFLEAKADFLMISEQDHLYTPYALEKALDAFHQISELNLLSLHDHPGKYRNPHPENDFLLEKIFVVQPHYFSAPIPWRQVSCTTGCFIWRGTFYEQNELWFKSLALRNCQDHAMTFEYYQCGGLILEPCQSIIQHCRYDHSQDSPTFPFRADLEKLRR